DEGLAPPAGELPVRLETMMAMITMATSTTAPMMTSGFQSMFRPGPAAESSAAGSSMAAASPPVCPGVAPAGVEYHFFSGAEPSELAGAVSQSAGDIGGAAGDIGGAAG